MTEQLSGEFEATAPASAGGLLRAARESRGMTIADAARSLRLALRQAEALENDDFDKLPGNTFVRGFIRNYARLLQIDPEPVLAAYDAACPEQPVHAIETPSREIRFSTHGNVKVPLAKLAYVAATLAAIGLAAWGGYEYWQVERSRPAVEVKEPVPEATPLPLPPVQQEAAPAAPLPEAAAPVQAPETATTLELPPPPPPVVSATPSVTVPPPAPVATPAAPAFAPAEPVQARIKLVFDADSWVEIKDKDGKKIFSKLGRAGSEQLIQGDPPFALVVGNAAQVRLTYNDKPVDLAPHIKVTVARLTLQ